MTAFDPEYTAQWSAPVSYGPAAFMTTMQTLVRHPERTSSSILRADILPSQENHTSHQPWSLKEHYYRRLMPRNPNRDNDMLQHCYFYDNEDTILVIYETASEHIPYYHPQVDAIAFEYTPTTLTISCKAARLDERLSRTCLKLGTIINKFSIGNQNKYQKRVHHDLVVDRICWQDRYTKLKLSYAQEYCSRWIESTDPRKHVFEDLGIAAFLIELWTGRPRFVDVGCGNGLLVDILHREGYDGYGFDARRRKSWSVYPSADLREATFVPSFMTSTDPREFTDEFLIGNHADELTPWIPLLAALASSGRSHPGFLIIPCCMHTFDGGKHQALKSKGGRYAHYVLFLREICEAVGWVVEQEFLRIPSTRNVALICRERRPVEMDIDIDGTDPYERLVHLCRSIVDGHGGASGFNDRCTNLRTCSH